MADRVNVMLKKASKHIFFYVNTCYPEGFPKHIFRKGVVATALRIINTEGHITLNLQRVYRY